MHQNPRGGYLHGQRYQTIKPRHPKWRSRKGEVAVKKRRAENGPGRGEMTPWGFIASSTWFLVFLQRIYGNLSINLG
jgi:hypothetical protein